MEVPEPIVSSNDDVVESTVEISPPEESTVEVKQAYAYDNVYIADDFKEKLIKQVEYYFSDENLPTDKFMRNQIKRDKEGFVRISVIASFNKMKKLTTDTAIIETALRESSQLILSYDRKKVKRRHPFPFTVAKDAKLCTVLVENLPEDHSTENLRKIFGEVGNIKNISVIDPHAVKESSKGGKKENEKLFSSKLHALVEYDTVEAAEKAVATLNNEQDWRNGMRVKLLKHIGMYGKKTWRGSDSEKSSNARGPNQAANGENHNSSKHQAGTGESHNSSKHQAGTGESLNSSKHHVGTGESLNSSKHQAGTGESQNSSKHQAGSGDRHNSSKHQAGSGDGHNSGKHQAGSGDGHNSGKHQAGSGDRHNSSKHQAGSGETHNSSKHQAGSGETHNSSKHQAESGENLNSSKHQPEDKENHKLSKYHEETHDEEDGGQHLQKEKAGKRNRRRGPPRGQKYHGTNGHGHGTTSSIYGIEVSKPPPGPKMPDGTRGFTMGRGRPPVSNQN